MNAENEFEENDGDQYEESGVVCLPNGVKSEKHGWLRYLNLREMGGTEEEILIRKQYSRDGSTMRRLLASTVVGIGPTERDVGMIESRDEIEKIVAGMRNSDAIYSLLRLRLLSEDDPTFRYRLKCPHCEAMTSYRVDLQDHIDKNTEFRPDTEAPQTSYEAVYRGSTYVYRPLMLSDSAELAMTQRTDPHMILTAQLACSIVTIDGKKLPAMSDVSALPKRARTWLRSQINKCDYGTNVEVLNTCSQCSAEFKSKLPITSLDFFFPEANSD